MKKILAILMFTLAIGKGLFAQDIKNDEPRQFMQVTSIESVLAGGLGRSKIIVTNADGTQVEEDLANLFSMIGINFKNIRENEDKLIRTLKTYIDKGWKLEQTTALTLSPNDSGSGGIFMTRYLFSKATEKNKM